MSFDDLAANGRPATETVDVERDVACLNSFVAACEGIPADDSELSELLARLDSAHTVAGGVEAKLDELLGTLDGLLTSLEPNDTQETMIPSKSPSERLHDSN